MPIEIKIEKERYDNKPVQTVNDTDYFGTKSKIVVQLISRWGMISCIEDGEDSSGRAKVRLATEEELVKRAFKIADLMFNELEMRDWLVQTNTFETMDQAVENIIEEKENNKALSNNH